MQQTARVLFVLGFLLCACSSEPVVDSPDASPCMPVVTAHEPVPGSHVPVDTEIEWPTNPPSSGDHFGVWAKWNRTYSDPPLERGYWVHNMEHGGVTLLYKCPDGCAEDVARIEAFADTIAADSSCQAPVKNRVLITADPLLPEGAPIALAAWGYTYSASCVDENSMRSFVEAHYGKGPEAVCAQGSYEPPGPTPAD